MRVVPVLVRDLRHREPWESAVRLVQHVVADFVLDDALLVVSFINHSTAPDHSFDYTLFNISTSSRSDNDVSPYRNMADHVYRFC
jgi:hypothetical protein